MEPDPNFLQTSFWVSNSATRELVSLAWCPHSFISRRSMCSVTPLAESKWVEAEAAKASRQ